MVFNDYVTTTQDAIIPYLKNINALGVLLVAKTQTKGRGRGSNKWCSPEGGFWATLGIKCDSIPKTRQFALLHYSCVCFLKNLLYEKYKIKIQIKWPNDLYYNHRKLGGILIEFFQLDNQNYLLLGMGINFNNRSTSFETPLRDQSISVSEITQKTIGFDDFAQLIVHDIINYIYPILVNNEKFISALVDNYNKSILQKEITLLNENQEKVKFETKGISIEGFFKIKNQNHELNLSIDDSSKIISYIPN
ncbi:MAG: biotin--[acetyl-CoA-carboxylase] ligase [Candidatus Lokiarchaeota archaeon]